MTLKRRSIEKGIDGRVIPLGNPVKGKAVLIAVTGRFFHKMFEYLRRMFPSVDLIDHRQVVTENLESMIGEVFLEWFLFTPANGALNRMPTSGI